MLKGITNTCWVGCFKDVLENPFVVASCADLPYQYDRAQDRSLDLQKGANPSLIADSMHVSLKRLGLDYMDIFYLGSVGTREVTLHEPYMKAFEKLKRDGKTRCVGVTTHRNEPEVIRAVAESGFWDVVLTACNFTATRRTPLRTGAKAMKDGAWPAADEAMGKIYASRGYKQPDFYAYYPLGDSWKALSPWLPGTEGKLPSKGSQGCSNGQGTVYATKGNNTQGFWRYSIDSTPGNRVYYDSATTNIPAGGAEVTVTFSTWPKPYQYRTYSTWSKVAAPGDGKPGNDSLTGTFKFSSAPPAWYAQGLAVGEAAALGACLHARAADLAAAAEGEGGLHATDLLPWLRRLLNGCVAEREPG